MHGKKKTNDETKQREKHFHLSQIIMQRNIYFAFPQNFHTRKSDEITVFFAVLISGDKCYVNTTPK